MCVSRLMRACDAGLCTRVVARYGRERERERDSDER